MGWNMLINQLLSWCYSLRFPNVDSMNLWYWWSLKITIFDINSWIPGCPWSSYPWRQKIWWWEKSHNLLRSTITLVTIPARMQKSIDTYTTSLRFFASIVQQQNHLIEVPAAKFQHLIWWRMHQNGNVYYTCCKHDHEPWIFGKYDIWIHVQWIGLRENLLV